MKKILVIGSINVDEVSFIDNFPNIGETIHSYNREIFHGGKGANQAVAIKRLAKQSVKVSFFGKVSSKKEGDEEIDHLEKNGIDCKYVFRSNKKNGKALILMSDVERDNMIIVDAGANNDFNKDDLINLTKAIKEHNYILLQLETNSYLVEKSLKISKKFNKTTFLNPAPANYFDSSWIPLIDWLFPNETELELITNMSSSSIGNIEKATIHLNKLGLKNCLVTLGSKGAALFTNREFTYLETEKVNPIDTTAAGDTFIGAFVGNYSKEQNKDAVKYSMEAAKITVMRKGAQASIPFVKEIKYEK